MKTSYVTPTSATPTGGTTTNVQHSTSDKTTTTPLVDISLKLQRKGSELGSKNLVTTTTANTTATVTTTSTLTTTTTTNQTKQFSWKPPGILQDSMVEQYFVDNYESDQIPWQGSDGEQFWEELFRYQYPEQDIGIGYCQRIDSDRIPLFNWLLNDRNCNALEFADTYHVTEDNLNCTKCDQQLKAGTDSALADLLDPPALFHPDCFRCYSCDQLLSHNIYCCHQNRLYCQRHYLELFCPRCPTCSELIFAKTFLKELSQNWHMDHFNCWSCDQSLAGGRYVVRDQKQFCIKCFEQQHANVCDECQKPIGIESKDLSYKERHWHEACFICNKCKVTLINKPFGTKSERIYCGDCYDQMFGSRCDKCEEVFRAGQRKLEYKGKQWHDQCFVCNKCQVPIGTKSFVPKETDIFCSECYETKFATRCVKCCEVILSNGIIYKEEPWHKECFRCNGCKTELAGTSFLVREEKPYCQTCFGNLFSHKCESCSKAIIGTGNGGTKFITYEDRFWHTGCFQCADCKTPLEGKGFIKDGPDIICGECARIKLASI